MTNNKAQESVSELTARLEAVSLELRNTQLDLEGVNDDLMSAQDELEDTRIMLDETELKLKNTQDAFAASESARRAANRDRVIARPESKRECPIDVKGAMAWASLCSMAEALFLGSLGSTATHGP
ncbi:hypothetical protein FBU30_003966 [Linnemannia zychae]|nr:hypothetical protein FBU30_003966 [Linnemannia zychae]